MQIKEKVTVWPKNKNYANSIERIQKENGANLFYWECNITQINVRVFERI